ncbi:MAG: HAMP domain-containing histidine kinase [Cytophagales bacterium]|nr:HAMP domain-containing histidine kinase [Cytophagales bacterium]
MDLNFHSEKEILKKNTLLSKTNRELDRFVYSASHELRAPLTSLLGLLDIAGRTSHKEELKKCHAMMHERIQSMDLLIKEIIDFTRNERLTLREEKFALRPLVQRILDDLKFMGPVHKQTIEIHIDAGLEITTDATRLKILLNNLISNSFKYADRHKPICTVAVGAHLENQHLIIWVKDNGQGISAEHHKKIFSMFYRGSEDSTGSGLGLYIVHEIVARLNGTIRLESTPGEGAIFTLRLPTGS